MRSNRVFIFLVVLVAAVVFFGVSAFAQEAEDDVNDEFWGVHPGCEFVDGVEHFPASYAPDAPCVPYDPCVPGEPNSYTLWLTLPCEPEVQETEVVVEEAPVEKPESTVAVAVADPPAPPAAPETNEAPMSLPETGNETIYMAGIAVLLITLGYGLLMIRKTSSERR